MMKLIDNTLLELFDGIKLMLHHHYVVQKSLRIVFLFSQTQLQTDLNTLESTVNGTDVSYIDTILLELITSILQLKVFILPTPEYFLVGHLIKSINLKFNYLFTLLIH